MTNLTVRELDALDRIEKKPALQPFFFRKLKGLKWFDALQERGFFNPVNNPKPVETDQEGYFNIPSWPILDYLEKTAPELQQPDNIDYAIKHMQLIRDVTKDAIERKIDNYRTWKCFSKIVRFIPANLITDVDIELFDCWLNDRFDRMLIGIELGQHLLPRFLTADSEHTRNLAIGLINAMTMLSWRPKRWGKEGELEPSLPVKAYHSGKIFRANAKMIGEKLESDGVNIFKARIAEILSKSDKDRYSTIWRPAIEDHDQNKSRDETTNILISAFRDALLGYIDRRATSASDYITDLLEGEVLVFQRVAIYVVGIYNKHLSGFVQGLIDEKYFKHHYQHEMYHLLNSCFSDFNSDEKKKVLHVIEQVAREKRDSDQSKEIQNKQQAYACLRWLSAIRGLGCQQADDLYAKYLTITGVEPEHPDFSSYMGVGWVGETSPYKAEELLSRDIDELIETLRTFKEQDGWKTPTRHGLSLALKEALKANPEYFKGHLYRFLEMDYDYSYQLIEGYRELWKENKSDNWVELFHYCWALLQSEGFWSKDSADQGRQMTASTDWIVAAVSELIRAGTADDEAAFDQTMMPIAGQIIEYILDNQEGEPFAEERDAVSIAINSPRGKCIEALINFALRLCRLEDSGEKGHEELWTKELQPVFDKQMGQVQDGNYEFVTLLTNYLPNFLYLSWSWTMKQLPIVFDKENRLRWLCAIQGYTYVNQIYAEVYKLLRDNSHLRDALDAKELESRGRDKIIQNIIIAYFQDDEILEDMNGALSWLIDRWLLVELQELTWFIWTIRDPESDITGKLMPLWIRLSDRADPSNETGKRVLSRLCMWSVFINELDSQSMELLLKSAPYANLEHDAYILIEELKRLVEQYPDQVADIYIRMLDGFAPTYQQEDIEYVITKLYEKGGEIRQKANTICDRYIEHEIEFPAEIRAKFAHT